MCFLFTNGKFLSNMVNNILLEPLSSSPKKLSICDDKMPYNNWLLCQKKIASSCLLLTPPLFINSSFTLKYQTVVYSFQTLFMLTSLGGFKSTSLTLGLLCKKADLISLLWIFHDRKVFNASTSLKFSLLHVGESFLTKFLSISSKPQATNLALTVETPSQVFFESTQLTDISSILYEVMKGNLKSLYFFYEKISHALKQKIQANKNKKNKIFMRIKISKRKKVTCLQLPLTTSFTILLPITTMKIFLFLWSS